jgi:hypothetical protein
MAKRTYIPCYPHISKKLSDEIDAFIERLHAEQERSEDGQTSIMLPGVRELAIELVHLARCHHRIQERECMGDLTKWSTTREHNVMGRINSIADRFDALAVFSRDPRGCTVTLWLKSGVTNDWGRTGYCVPTF